MSDEREPNVCFLGTPKRGRGRPRTADAKERVSTRLPPATFERLRKAASSRDQSMSLLASQIIEKALGR